MEIERKYLITTLPFSLQDYRSRAIQQAYISTSPVIRIRQLDDQYILTVKGKGTLAREEFELFLSKDEFLNLSKKAEGYIIEKTRYYIPFKNYIIELDIFNGHHEGLILAEVEFEDLQEANLFIPPDWFGRDVTELPTYHNSYLSRHTLKDIQSL